MHIPSGRTTFSFVGTLRIVTTFVCDPSTGHCGDFRSTIANRSTLVDFVDRRQFPIFRLNRGFFWLVEER